MRVPALKFLFLLFLLIPSQTHAIGLHIGTHIGFGQIGNTSQILTDRSVGTFDVNVLPGYRLGSFLLGVLGEYRSVSQVTLRTAATGLDLSGSGTSFGAAVSYEPSLWKFILGYDISGQHTVSAGDRHYKGSGLRLLMGYQFAPKFFVDFSYLKLAFNKYETAGVITDITTDKLNFWNFCIGISVSL